MACGQAREELGHCGFVLFLVQIEPFSVTLSRQNDQGFVRTDRLSVKALGNRRRHPAVVRERHEKDGTVADAGDSFDEVKSDGRNPPRQASK